VKGCYIVLSYDEDVFAVWECSWAATTCSTPDFGLFFALAMLENYRDVILDNDMDFPAIVKFFNGNLVYKPSFASSLLE